MNQTQEIFYLIESLINPKFLKSAPLELQENKSTYFSVVIQPENNVYRSMTNDVSIVFCRIKTSAKTKYVSFNNKYQPYFENAGIHCQPEGKQSNFFRVSLDVFAPLSNYQNVLPTILDNIFIECFSFAPFGCCSKFQMCSDEKSCLHEDQVYSMACIYRKNLDLGRIFYGINRNI